MPYDFPEFCLEKALAFRILHMDNIPDALRIGARSITSAATNQAYVPIGNSDIIEKRKKKAVTAPPGGVLADYVPFYFSPRSMMLFNILTGYSVTKRRPDEIAILVTSVPHLVKRQTAFVFSDGHALMAQTKFFNDPGELHRIDWDILRRSDSMKSDSDPGKSQRYQAELLVHDRVEVADLLGLACFDGTSRAKLERVASEAGVTITVRERPKWYPR